MQNYELKKQISRIEELFKKTQTASLQDMELQAHWGRYLCVLVAGFMENAICEIYAEFARRAPQPIADYAISRLSRIMNPKAERFVNTARAFKAEWGDELEKFFADNGRKDAVDSIMTNRHQIAHGGNNGITVARVKSYLDKCVEIVDFIEKQTTR